MQLSLCGHARLPECVDALLHAVSSAAIGAVDDLPFLPRNIGKPIELEAAAFT